MFKYRGGNMLRKKMIAGAILLFIAVNAHGQGSHSRIKGYELYSWKMKGRWHYSIVPGTNRSKTYEEIMSKQVVRIGDAALKAELKKIPKGEEIFWMSDAPPNLEKPKSGLYFDLKMPSRKRIKSIKAYCDRLGIKLKLV
jgi:hypothetical protein